MKGSQKSLCSILLLGTLVAAPAWPGAPDRATEARECRYSDWGLVKGELALVLEPTSAAPTTGGKLRLKLKKESIGVRVEARSLGEPTRFGNEYLTYVVWAVDSQGRMENLGELDRKKQRGTLVTEIRRRPYGFMVTAEPHFDVQWPNDHIVLRAAPRGKAAKILGSHDVACHMLPHGGYAFGRSAEDMSLMLRNDGRTPNEISQALNSLEIARQAGAERHARPHFEEAVSKILTANSLWSRGKKKAAKQEAREAVATAEISHRVSVERQNELGQMQAAIEDALRVNADQARQLEEAQQRARRAAEERAELENRLLESRREKPRDDGPDVREPTSPTSGSAADVRSDLQTRETERDSLVRQLEAARAEARMVAEKTEQQIRSSREQTLLDVEQRLRQQEMERDRQILEVQSELARARLQTEQAELAAELARERGRLEAERSLVERERARAEESLRTSQVAADPVVLEEDPFTREALGEEPPVTVREPAPEMTSGQTRNREPSTTAFARTPEPSITLVEPTPEPRPVEMQPGAPAAELDPADTGTTESKPRKWWAPWRKQTSSQPALSERASLEPERPTVDTFAADQTTASEIDAADPPAKPRRWWAPWRKKAELAAPEQDDQPDISGGSSGDSWSFRLRRDAEPAPSVPKATVEPPALEAALLESERRRLESEKQLEMAQLAAEQERRLNRVIDERIPPPKQQLTPAPSAGVAADSTLNAELLRQREQLLELQRLLIEQQAGVTVSTSADLPETQAAAERAPDPEVERTEFEDLLARVERAESALDTRETIVEPDVPLEALPVPDLLDRLKPQLERLFETDWSDEGVRVRLTELSFASGRSDLPPKARESLARLAGILLTGPEISITIEGHTDASGDALNNLALSGRRAAEVAVFLQEQGLSPRSMTSRGYGEAQPVATNETVDGRHKNRRVDLILSDRSRTAS